MASLNTQRIVIFFALNPPVILQVSHKALCSLTTPFTFQPQSLLPLTCSMSSSPPTHPSLSYTHTHTQTYTRSLSCPKALHLLPPSGSYFPALLVPQDCTHVTSSRRTSLIPASYLSLPHHSLFLSLYPAHFTVTYLSVVHFQSLQLSAKLLQGARVGLCPSDSPTSPPESDM